MVVGAVSVTSVREGRENGMFGDISFHFKNFGNEERESYEERVSDSSSGKRESRQTEVLLYKQTGEESL